MVKGHYRSTLDWIDARRHKLLLFATLTVLLLPAFSGSGLLSDVLFVFSMSFLFIQSTVAARVKKSTRQWMRLIVVLLIILFALKPAGISSLYLGIVQLLLLVSFFVVIASYLLRFVIRSGRVTTDVLITAVNIYLIIGIISASTAFLFNSIYEDAYSFPAHISDPRFASFLYFSLITLTTVGFGDIVPKIPETQALSFMTAITGQLYVAIAIAFLVGKFLVHSGDEHKDQSSV